VLELLVDLAPMLLGAFVVSFVLVWLLIRKP